MKLWWLTDSGRLATERRAVEALALVARLEADVLRLVRQRADLRRDDRGEGVLQEGAPGAAVPRELMGAGAELAGPAE